MKILYVWSNANIVTLFFFFIYQKCLNLCLFFQLHYFGPIYYFPEIIYSHGQLDFVVCAVLYSKYFKNNKNVYIRSRKIMEQREGWKTRRLIVWINECSGIDENKKRGTQWHKIRSNKNLTVKYRKKSDSFCKTNVFLLKTQKQIIY